MMIGGKWSALFTTYKYWGKFEMLKILISFVIFTVTFLLLRPADPATPEQIVFWSNAARFFGVRNPEEFVGIALVIVCSLITLIGYQIAVYLIKKIG